MTTPLTGDGLLPFVPPSLRPADPADKPEVVIYLRTPTWQERDEITHTLYRLGVRNVSADAVRATMISELFRIRPETADDDAAFLDGYWQQQQVHDAAVKEWRDREMQRLLDVDADPSVAELVQKAREEDPIPEPPVSLRDQARAQLLTQEIIDESEKVRTRMIEQTLYSARFTDLVARRQIMRWEGLDADHARDANDLLSIEATEAFRTSLYSHSRTAWREICTEAELLFTLPTVEVGNSDSPPENTSTGDGSPPATDGPASSDGASTKPATGTSSTTSPAPGAGSKTSTGRSSGSTRGSADARKKPGPTAER